MADNKTKVTEHNQRLLNVLENMNNAQAGKANVDASNLTEENVQSWKDKLNIEAEYDDTELRNADSALDARVKTAITSVTHTPNTGLFTFTREDGTTFTVDTLLEKVVTNFTYNETNKTLDLTLEDGTVKSIPMSAFISENKPQIENNIIGSVSTKSTKILPSNKWIKTISTNTYMYGQYVWTDGANIYYSQGTSQKQYNTATKKWENKTWEGLTSFYGNHIFNDGLGPICLEGSSGYYRLINGVWTPITVTASGSNVTDLTGNNIWTDGDTIFYSNGMYRQYYLSSSTMTSLVFYNKSWTVSQDYLVAHNIWSDGKDVYLSYLLNGEYAYHYKYNKSNQSFDELVEWNTDRLVSGANVWTDGTDVYLANGSATILKLVDGQWEDTGWISETGIYGINIWTDGEYIHYLDNVQYSKKINKNSSKETSGSGGGGSGALQVLEVTGRPTAIFDKIRATGFWESGKILKLDVIGGASASAKATASSITTTGSGTSTTEQVTLFHSGSRRTFYPMFNDYNERQFVCKTTTTTWTLYFQYDDPDISYMSLTPVSNGLNIKYVSKTWLPDLDNLSNYTFRLFYFE